MTYAVMDGLNNLSALQNDSSALQSKGFTLFSGDVTSADFPKDINFYDSLLTSIRSIMDNLTNLKPIILTSVTSSYNSTTEATTVTCICATAVPATINVGTIAGVTPDDYNWPNMTLDFTGHTDRLGFKYVIPNVQITVSGSASSDNGMFLLPQTNQIGSAQKRTVPNPLDHSKSL